MDKRKKESLWSDIKSISETQEGRQAMMTTGSVIAAAYLGYVGPDLLVTMHDALAFYALKYPLMDPQAMSSALWGGAQYYTAAGLDFIGNLSDTVSFELSHTMRESVQTAREFLSRSGERGIEAARVAFDETSQYVGHYANGALQNIGTALHSGYNAVKEHWGAVVAVGAAVKEAYDFYTTGESIFKRLFGRGKKDSKAETQVEANISVNVAIGGAGVLASADAALSTDKVKDPVKVDMDRIIWISDQLRDQIATQACDLEGLGTSERTPPLNAEQRAERDRVRSAVERALHQHDLGVPQNALTKIGLASSDIANKLNERWDESSVSAGRFQSIRGQVRKTSHMEYDLTDPLAFVKGSQASSEESNVGGDKLVAANDNKFDRPSDDGPCLM